MPDIPKWDGCTCSNNGSECAALVDRSRNGDSLARDKLLEKLRPLIYKIARNTLRGVLRQEADDVLQNICVKLLGNSLSQWAGKGEFCHWVETVARCESFEIARRAGRFPVTKNDFENLVGEGFKRQLAESQELRITRTGRIPPQDDYSRVVGFRRAKIEIESCPDTSVSLLHAVFVP